MNAAHQPYMDNDSEIDRIDYQCLLDSIGEMNMISTQVLQDVVDEMQGAIDNRPAPESEDEDDPDSESLSEIARTENAIIDRQES